LKKDFQISSGIAKIDIDTTPKTWVVVPVPFPKGTIFEENHLNWIYHFYPFLSMLGNLGKL